MNPKNNLFAFVCFLFCVMNQQESQLLIFTLHRKSLVVDLFVCLFVCTTRLRQLQQRHIFGRRPVKCFSGSQQTFMALALRLRSQERKPYWRTQWEMKRHKPWACPWRPPSHYHIISLSVKHLDQWCPVQYHWLLLDINQATRIHNTWSSNILQRSHAFIGCSGSLN